MTDVTNQQEQITAQVAELNAEAASKAQEHSIREKNAKNAKISSSAVGGAMAGAAAVGGVTVCATIGPVGWFAVGASALFGLGGGAAALQKHQIEILEKEMSAA